MTAPKTTHSKKTHEPATEKGTTAMSTRTNHHATATTTAPENTPMATTDPQTTNETGTPEATAGPTPTPANVGAAPIPVPAPPYVTTCMDLLAKVDQALPAGASLTATDKKRQGKARKGGERYIPQLVSLAKQYGVVLALVPLDDIVNESNEAQALVPLQLEVARLQKRINDRLFEVQGTSWTQASKLYVVLKRLAKDNGQLANGLSAIAQFFSSRHPLVAKNHPKTKAGKAALAKEKAAGAPQPEAGPSPHTPAAPAPAPGTSTTAHAAP